MSPDPAAVLVIAEVDLSDVRKLLASVRLEFMLEPDHAPIPGSYWGEPEAGIIGRCVHARLDSPVHSVLHEAAHLAVAAAEGRHDIHTDASDSTIEEDATCYLEVIWAERLKGVGRERILSDMDAWGYTFRLGSAKRWFEEDAEDARAWLAERGLV
jgi:hypothetical protein